MVFFFKIHKFVYAIKFQTVYTVVFIFTYLCKTLKDWRESNRVCKFVSRTLSNVYQPITVTRSLVSKKLRRSVEINQYPVCLLHRLFVNETPVYLMFLLRWPGKRYLGNPYCKVPLAYMYKWQYWMALSSFSEK